MNDCDRENGQSSGKPCRVLILGGGFGGIYTALELEKLLPRRDDVTVTLVTRDNFFLFTPMLHEVATSDLEINTIINPLHKLLSRVSTFIGNIEAIDLTAKSVHLSHGFDRHCHELPFDQLILALGASTNFFGLPGVEANALALRTISDAVALRSRLISQLEEANSECAIGGRKPLLTFVVAGGGFAGVETIGGINDFVRQSIRFYPALSEADVRMVLVTPDELILAELGPELGAYAQRELASRGIEILTRARVAGYKNGSVLISDGRSVPASTMVWTAGNCGNPLVASLSLPNRGGRLLVNEYLEVENTPGMWALGDCAMVPNPLTNGFHPATAQHALRQGRVLARNLVAEIAGTKKKRFRFSALGQLASIGRRTGVANIFGMKFSGFFAWWLWRTVYLCKLPRLEKKVRVALDWTLDLCFAKDLACVTEPRTKVVSSESGVQETMSKAQSVRGSRHLAWIEREAASPRRQLQNKRQIRLHRLL
jgi:NADH:ubiquinone reductase (H+-translocating)